MKYRNQVKEEAAEWVLLLSESDDTNFPVAEWRKWMMLSPTNQQVFRTMLEVWSISDTVEFNSELITVVDSSRAELENEARVGVMQKRPSRNSAIAACGLVFAIAMIWLVNSIAPDSAQDSLSEFSASHSTRVGEHRSIPLADGSKIDIGAGTSLDIEFNNSSRNVVLHKGESFFKVVDDSIRPFMVFANRSQFKAVGTAFNVKRLPDGITVSVSEGEVEVASLKEPISTIAEVHSKPIARQEQSILKFGDVVNVSNHGVIEAREFIDPKFQTAWRQGRLVFDNQPLRSVVADLNRYSDIQIEIVGREVSELVFSGAVQQEKIVEWLGALPKALRVKVDTRPGKIVISSATDL